MVKTNPNNVISIFGTEVVGKHMTPEEIIFYRHHPELFKCGDDYDCHGNYLGELDTNGVLKFL